ncbi:MAG: hypothetical protein ACOYJS_02105 [Acutalibacteraceae bacterium]
MQPFRPVNLQDINKSLIDKYPLPEDFAKADISVAEEILADMREQNKGFFEISALELNYAFLFAQICTDKEFEVLKTAVLYKSDKNLFHIGLICFQMNAEDERTAELFSIICAKTQKKQPEIFESSLLGKTGLNLAEIYAKSLEVMELEKLSFNDFCAKYNIIADSVFYNNLKLLHFSKCEKDEFLLCEDFLLERILSAKTEFLRPALRNFTEKVGFDEISDKLKNALLERLSNEENDMALGLSNEFLKEIRQQKYGKMLKNHFPKGLKKLEVYLSIVNRIKNIQLLECGYISILFENYTVLDNKDWETHAYAYSHQTFENLFESWLSLGTPEDYWPAISQDKIIPAREIFLGANQSGAIKLEFKEFDILYAKDLLSGSRY